MPGERWDPVERDRIYGEKKRRKLTRCVSEGDSWFDYPPHLNIIDWVDATDKYALMRFEVSGDTVENMTTPANLALLTKVVKKEKPSCLMFSGGGNDLFTKIPEQPGLRWIYRAFRNAIPGGSARDHIDEAAWDTKKTELRLGFARLINAVGQHVPIVTHGYDYLVPNGKPVMYDGFRLGGPWILPALKKRGINDPKLQRAVLHEIIDDFNRILESLATTYPTTVVYVDLRGTLDEQADWLNEIHATEDGFRRIAEKFTAVLQKKLPKVIKKRVGENPP